MNNKVQTRVTLLIFLVFISSFSIAQTSYRNELGGRITKTQFEDQITNGPYFGIPGENEGEKVLVYRMPVGMVDDPKVFYEKVDELEAFESGQLLIVIFYPGPDECNSNSGDFEIQSMKKADKSLRKWAQKRNAAPPIYLYNNRGGLLKYEEFMDWKEDPEGVFQSQFFKYPYPCKSFVVLHPSGDYRAILEISR